MYNLGAYRELKERDIAQHHRWRQGLELAFARRFFNEPIFRALLGPEQSDSLLRDVFRQLGKLDDVTRRARDDRLRLVLVRALGPSRHHLRSVRGACRRARTVGRFGPFPSAP